MGKFLFELIKNPLGLPINPLWEYLIFGLIGELAFRVAWAVSPGGQGGSDMHWTVRIITYFGSWAVIRVGVWLYGIIVAYWLIVICTVVALFIGLAVGYLLARKYYCKKVDSQNEKDEKQ